MPYKDKEFGKMKKREYYNLNKNEMLNKSKEYYKLNKEKVREYQNLNKEKFSKMHKEQMKKYKEQWIILFKEKGMDKCSKCGYNKCFTAIHFHHILSSEKKSPISDLTKRPISQDSLEELDKCIALCANCHTELHNLERKKQ